MITSDRRLVLSSVGALILAAMVGTAAAQDIKEGQSAALSKELAQLMDAKKLTTLAAKHGSDPEAFAAAMYFSGSQLLVVGADYEPAVLLNEKLFRKEYQEIYIDLNSAAKAGTRVFFEDLGADGLKPVRQEGRGFDSADIGGKRTTFDEQWRREQRISEEQWAKLYADADKLYCRLLESLIKEARK